jgi:hypothetical protein
MPLFEIYAHNQQQNGYQISFKGGNSHAVALGILKWTKAVHSPLAFLHGINIVLGCNKLAKLPLRPAEVLVLDLLLCWNAR